MLAFSPAHLMASFNRLCQPSTSVLAHTVWMKTSWMVDDDIRNDSWLFCQYNENHLSVLIIGYDLLYHLHNSNMVSSLNFEKWPNVIMRMSERMQRWSSILRIWKTCIRTRWEWDLPMLDMDRGFNIKVLKNYIIYIILLWGDKHWNFPILLPYSFMYSAIQAFHKTYGLIFYTLKFATMFLYCMRS